MGITLISCLDSYRGDLKEGKTTVRKDLESASKKVGKTTSLPLEKGVGRDLKINIIRKEGKTSTRKVGKTTIEEKVAETGVGETTTLRRAGGTLVRIGEGVARGPLVMEGP